MSGNRLPRTQPGCIIDITNNLPNKRAYLRPLRADFDQISPELALTHIYLMDTSTNSLKRIRQQTKNRLSGTRPAIKTYKKTRKSTLSPKLNRKKFFFSRTTHTKPIRHVMNDMISV